KTEQKPKKIEDVKSIAPMYKGKARRTEDEIYDKFDREMQEVVAKVSNKIAIFFLFCQGILAGMCLTNIFLLFQFQNFTNFIDFYSFFSREIFNFMYVLTFVSLIGNGVKFLNSYKKCKSLNDC